MRADIDQWHASYIAQGEQKRAQIEQVIRYAESNQCRMATLVRHFGDLADGQKPCGICDFCAPGQCAAQRFRTATEAEHTALLRVVAALRSGGAKSTGKLHGELCPNREMSRDAFEEVLGAMARAGLVQLLDAVFEKNGKQIPYRNVSLTRAGYTVDERTPVEPIAEGHRGPVHEAQEEEAHCFRESEAGIGTRYRGTAQARGRGERVRSRDAPPPGSGAARLASDGKYRRRGVPAFRIFSDRTLRALATSRPGTAQELLAVPGIGISSVEKYGRDIYRVLRENGG